MKKILFIIAGLMFISLGTQASEMMYQPGAKKFTLKGNLSFTGTNFEINHDPINSLSKHEEDITDISINFFGQYGINKNMALQFGLGYGNLQIDETAIVIDPITGIETKQKDDYELTGTNPLFVGLQNRNKLGKGILFTRGAIVYGVSKKDHENRTAGNLIVNLGLAYELMAGPGKLGFLLDFILPVTDGKLKNGQSFELDSNYSFNAFYEIKLKDILYGFSASYTIGNANLNSPNAYFAQADPDDFINTSLYAKVPFGTISFLPSLNLSSDLEDRQSTFIYGINFGFRYHF